MAKLSQPVDRIEDAETVFVLADNAVVIPTQSEIESKPGKQLPIVLRVETVIVLQGASFTYACSLASSGRRTGQEIVDRNSVVVRRGRVVGVEALELQHAAISGVKELFHKRAAIFVTPLEVVPPGRKGIIVEELDVLVSAAAIDARRGPEVRESGYAELRHAEVARIGYSVVQADGGRIEMLVLREESFEESV